MPSYIHIWAVGEGGDGKAVLGSNISLIYPLNWLMNNSKVKNLKCSITSFSTRLTILIEYKLVIDIADIDAYMYVSASNMVNCLDKSTRDKCHTVQTFKTSNVLLSTVTLLPKYGSKCLLVWKSFLSLKSSSFSFSYCPPIYNESQKIWSSHFKKSANFKLDVRSSCPKVTQNRKKP